MLIIELYRAAQHCSRAAAAAAAAAEAAAAAAVAAARLRSRSHWSKIPRNAVTSASGSSAMRWCPAPGISIGTAPLWCRAISSRFVVVSVSKDTERPWRVWENRANGTARRVLGGRLHRIEFCSSVGYTCRDAEVDSVYMYSAVCRAKDPQRAPVNSAHALSPTRKRHHHTIKHLIVK